MRKNYYIRKILDYLGVSFLLGVLCLLWILYQGPISVPFLKPYIIKALNSEQSEFTVNIGEVNIELVRSIQPLKIIAKNVSLKKNDDTVSVKTKKLFLSFSIRALLKGMIAPSSILIKNPEVAVFTTYGVEKNKENEVNRKKIEYYADWFRDFLKRFNSQDKIYPESYISDILIQNANIEFHEVDLGRKWQFTNTNLYFERALTNLKLSADGIVDLGDRMATTSATATYRFSEKKLTLDFSFADVVVSDFIKNIGGGISNIDVPIEGKIETSLNFQKILSNEADIVQSFDAALETIDFNIQGGKGKIAFEDDDHFDYKIDSFVLNGSIKGGLDKIELKKAELATDMQQLALGVSIFGYKKYFFEKSLEDLRIELKAKTNRLMMDDLAKFWPRYYAEPAWEWCRDNLYGGAYKNVSFIFEWVYDNKQDTLALSKLFGVADIEDGTISYLEGMPEVTNVYGKARFDIGVIDIFLDKGISDSVMLNEGRVKLYDLNKEHNYIDITIDGDSSVSNALAYVANPPLEFGQDFKIKPDDITGDVNIKLNLNFELYQDLKPEEIKVKTNAVLKDVAIKNVWDDKDLSISKASLDIDEKGFIIKGDALFDSIPLEFDYKSLFDAKDAKTTARFNFIYDANIGRKLHINHALLDAPYIKGSANVTAYMTITDNMTKIDATADLEHMALDYGFLGFQKNVSSRGDIKARFDIKEDRLYDVPYFEISDDSFYIKGKVSLDNKGDIKVVDIEKIEGPKTSAAARIEFSNTAKQHIKLNVSGNSYDLTELFARREKEQKQKAKESSAVSFDDDFKDVPNVDIFIAVNSLWTNPETPIKNFAGSAVLKNGVGMEEVHLIGNYGSDKSIKLNLDYTPRPNGAHLLNIESNNAGSTLRVLRLYENMNGGNLKIEAIADANNKFTGHAKIRDFKIHNTPLLAKLLTVASFSGMLDLLKGDGLVFSHFDAPFSYKNKTLKIDDAKMFGNVIGLSASGTINRVTEDIDIKGVISPAYGLNSMVGKIPLLGKMLAGKDGTIFAVNYTITDTIDEPKITINPLSILSPNSVKELFSEE